MAFQATFISDLHLGSPDAQPEPLLRFLEQLQSEQLYLVGDILDVYWMRRQRTHWTPLQARVIGAFRQLMRRGTEIIYLPGNHDQEFSALAGARLRGLQVRRQAVFQARDGRRFWVTHGDHVDARIAPSLPVQWLGEAAYRSLMVGDRLLRRWQGVSAEPAFSRLKRLSGAAVAHVERFRRAMLADTRSRGFDGVICGHIHRPELSEHAGCTYINDGDWVEHQSALIVHRQGGMELIDCRSRADALSTQPQAA